MVWITKVYSKVSLSWCDKADLGLAAGVGDTKAFSFPAISSASDGRQQVSLNFEVQDNNIDQREI